MLVALVIIVAYGVVRATAFGRSSAEIEQLGVDTVNKKTLRQRLGRAESLGIRVYDASSFAESVKNDRRRKRRKVLVLWLVVSAAVMYWSIGTFVAAAIFWVILVVSMGQAIAMLVTNLSSMGRGSRRSRLIALSLLYLVMLYAAVFEIVMSAQRFRWFGQIDTDHLVITTLRLVGGVAVVAAATAGLRQITVQANSAAGAADHASATSDVTLWLRSFNDDEVSLYSVTLFGVLSWVFGFRVRVEETVAMWSAIDGEVLAIGKPGEEYPLLGSTRTYVPDSDWQEVVAEMVQRAGVIILLAASTEGLGWELNHVRSVGRDSRLLVLLPPLPYEQSLARFRTIRRQLGLTDLEQLDVDNEGESIQFSLRVVAIGFSPTGYPVYYVGRGRDAASLEAVVKSAQALIRGAVSDPPLHGQIQREFDPAFPLSPQ